MSQFTSQNTTQALAYRDGDLIRVRPAARNDVRSAVLAFLDVAATATGRATFYNTREEQQDAINKTHDAVCSVNRGLYIAMLCLPGVTDDSIQRGIIRLLSNQHTDQSLLTYDQECCALRHLINHLLNTAPQRLFKLFMALKERRVNNRRTKRLIIESILNAAKLPFWAVKYRLKLRAALTHAWGIKVASGILKFVSNDEVALADASIVRRVCQALPAARQHILKYLTSWLDPLAIDLPLILESICFILGGKRTHWRTLIFQSFRDAHTDLARGNLLPQEVLEGIRGKLFKDTPKKLVFDLTKAQMTEGQKLSKQAEIERVGTTVEFDPSKQDLVKLYVYALERDQISDRERMDIRAAMTHKARRLADNFPLIYNKVAIILDTSLSMFGTGQGKRRPLAIALALRDVLQATARAESVVFADGRFDAYGLTQPLGDTALAHHLLSAFESGADVVYVITDGYENAPAGRFDEVLRLARSYGVTTPVYQLTPVLAAEVVGVRALSTAVTSLPVTRPEALGLSLVRAALNNDIEAGILGLLNTTKPLLEIN